MKETSLGIVRLSKVKLAYSRQVARVLQRTDKEKKLNIVRKFFQNFWPKIWPATTINAIFPLSSVETDGRMQLLTLEEKQVAVEESLRLLFQLEFHVLEEIRRVHHSFALLASHNGSVSPSKCEILYRYSKHDSSEARDHNSEHCDLCVA